MNERERIAELETSLAELHARLPKHSVPPAMIIELEDLEDELERLKARIGLDAD
jgi:hypothetical protein